jgi:hypothetical protein
MRFINRSARLILTGALAMLGFYACSDNPVSPVEFPGAYSGSHVYIGPDQDSTPAGFDFGYSPQDSKISHVFWLHNDSDDSLEIIKIVPG